MNARYCPRCYAVNEALASSCRLCCCSLSQSTDRHGPSTVAGSESGVSSRRALQTEIIHIGTRQISNRSGLASIVEKILTKPATEPESVPADTLATDHIRPAQIAPAQTDSRSLIETTTQSVRALAREQNRLSLPSLLLIVGLAGLFTTGAWLFYKDQAQTASRGSNGRSGLTLIAPDEQSQKLTYFGEQLFSEARYEESIAEFSRARELNPNNTQALIGLGRAYRQTGSIDEALKTYSRLLEIDQNNLEGRLQRADIYRTRGAWAEAWRDYRHIVNVAPNSEQGSLALDIMYRSTVDRPQTAVDARNARRNHARQPAGRVLPQSSDLSSVSLPLSSVVSDTTLPSSMVGTPSPSPAEDEFMHNAYVRRGTDLMNDKRYYAAIDELRKAQRINPSNPDVYYHLASAQMQMGQYEQARENYSRCTYGTYAAVARNGLKEAQKKASQSSKKQSKAGNKN